MGSSDKPSLPSVTMLSERFQKEGVPKYLEAAFQAICLDHEAVIVEKLRNGFSETVAARTCGFKPWLLYEFLGRVGYLHGSKKADDQVYLATWTRFQEALAESQELFESVVIDDAKSGSVSSAKWILERRCYGFKLKTDMPPHLRWRADELDVMRRENAYMFERYKVEASRAHAAGNITTDAWADLMNRIDSVPAVYSNASDDARKLAKAREADAARRERMEAKRRKSIEALVDASDA